MWLGPNSGFGPAQHHYVADNSADHLVDDTSRCETTNSSNPSTHLSAASTPRTGSVGTTTINASATLTDIPPSLSGTIEFDIHLGTGTQGQPASSVATPLHGPGTHPMPNGFAPKTP